MEFLDCTGWQWLAFQSEELFYIRRSTQSTWCMVRAVAIYNTHKQIVCKQQSLKSFPIHHINANNIFLFSDRPTPFFLLLQPLLFLSSSLFHSPPTFALIHLSHSASICVAHIHLPFPRSFVDPFKSSNCNTCCLPASFLLSSLAE